MKTIPYKIASINGTPQWDPSNPPIKAISRVIMEIVDVESPIHMDELVKRVADAWKFGRAGSRIRSTVTSIVKQLVNDKSITVRTSFVWKNNMIVPFIRNRSENIFGIETVSPEEINHAARQIRNLSSDISKDALVVEIARCLGYSRVSTQTGNYIREVLAD